MSVVTTEALKLGEKTKAFFSLKIKATISSDETKIKILLATDKRVLR